MHPVFIILKKEINQEIRQKHAINGILLYAASTVFICMLSFRSIIHPATWNALFWIIMLFASVNTLTKAFLYEQNERQLYIFSLISAQNLIIGKIIYNAVLLSLIGLITFLFYSLFIGNIVQDLSMFCLVLIIGCIAFSTILTFISAVSSKTSNNTSVMAILGIPLLTPTLLTVIKASKNAVDGLSRSESWDEILILVCLNIVAGLLSYILFPYLWRD